ncbi:MAG: nucleotidyltransferase domain-containing protein [Candidatus Aenigmatarchaeota archaeon]
MFNELDKLRLFFEEPAREFHLRELSRITKKNPVTVKTHLKSFVKTSVIKRKKERNLELYSANTENLYYKEYKRIYNKAKLFESGLIDFLKEEFSLPVIIIFGSYEKGEDNQNSDIDIFILTEVKKKLDIDDYEKKLNRSIQFHIMNKKEFETIKKKNPDLINNVINGSVIYGFFEVL